ncbi:helix-turn-helix domain-containing protein [Pseudonocardia sp. Cha107L01]|uniref:helix-turn-helix domain-containing protein n=1 Tax=Pseudonocardia sp. Cha107L01 TaxID=3457576 RepID=UPI00403E76F1
MSTGDWLAVAVRAWTDTPRKKRKGGAGRRGTAHILVIDTETKTDLSQAMTFGCYRYCRVDIGPDGQVTVTTAAEGLIYADDLPLTDPVGYALLVDYVRTARADVDLGYLGCQPDWRLGLCSRSEFVEDWLHRWAYRDYAGRGSRREPATVVMFNTPFDLSRLAGHAGLARGTQFAGGFSFALWTDAEGQPLDWRPAVRVKPIDPKRAFKGFSAIESRAQQRKRKKGTAFRGHFLDLRQMVFGLTSEGHRLASACKTFGVTDGKVAAEGGHGRITREYIDYCRRDVQATTELYEKVAREYQRHPIELQDTKVFSPASIAKAYYHAMGITPILDRIPEFSPEVLGQAMSAFYGGRAEDRIRQTPMPVVLCDCTSMYPTVDALMGMSELLIAETIEVVDATDELEALLDRIRLDDCFDPDAWRQFVGIVQIMPDGDILPVRAQYGPQPGWNIGINPLFATQPLWYTIPDAVASTLLTRRAPQVLRAIRFVPSGGKLSSLKPTRLRGQVRVDPNSDDFFSVVVSQRQSLKTSDSTLAAFLKVLANAGSYGVFAEIIREELGRGRHQAATVYGAHSHRWTKRVNAPERPGEYCFPPIAACITGAARLMLAMLERCVTDAGGSWVFADTDSMAIVANRGGTLVPCPGGPYKLPDGRAAVRALTFEQVDAIRARFQALNPYQPGAVADILKEEFRGHCYAISAKRYALYQLDNTGTPVIVSTGDDTDIPDEPFIEIDRDKHSQHGLGHLLNPTNPRSDDQEWIRQFWHLIVSHAHGVEVDEPEWLDRPALTQINVSSPTLWAPFAEWNQGKTFAQQIKPANFLLVGHVAKLGHPPGVDPRRFHLITAYESDPTKWADLPWRNLYDPHGPTYRATTARWNYLNDDGDGLDQPADLVQLKTYRQVLHDYLRHPEHKANGPDGRPCRSDTVGLLQRRDVHLAVLHHIGKEANRLDDITAGIIGSQDQILTDYTNATDTITSLILPPLSAYTIGELAEHTGLSKSQIKKIRTGKTAPRPQPLRALTELAVDTVLADLNQRGVDNPYQNIWRTNLYDDFESVLGYWRDHRNHRQRTCLCGCGVPIGRRRKYASEACRKRHARRMTTRRSRTPAVFSSR